MAKPTDQYRVVLNNGYITFADLNKKPKKKREEAEVKESSRSSKEPSPRFSSVSRNGLIKALRSLTSPPDYLITLTYKDNVSEIPADWKRNLDTLRRRLAHEYPDHWLIWRVEPHPESGKPHFHMVGSIGQQSDQMSFEKWLHLKWCKIIKADPAIDHLVTTVQRVSGGIEALERYIAKDERNCYGKYYNSWARLRARWGKIGKDNIPANEPSSYILSRSEYLEIKDLIIASVQGQIDALKKKVSSADSFTSKRKLYVLDKSIKKKADYLRKISRMDDFFSILDKEHIQLIEMVIKDMKSS